MTQTRRLKNVVLFIETILSFVPSKRIMSLTILNGYIEMLQLKTFKNMKN